MSITLIDAKTFTELQDTAGRDFVEELVATFLEEAPLMLDELRGALAEGDAARFRRTAHAMKSNGQSFGALPLAELARALELSGLPPDATGVEQLAALYQRTALALQEASREP